ncbi:hypothetical protein [Microbacterium sp. NPDC055665]
MDSTVAAAAISALAVLMSGLLTLVIAGNQEKRRRTDAADARDAERTARHAEQNRAECLAIAEVFYGMIDFFASFPVDWSWVDIRDAYEDRRAEKFDNSVRKAVAVGGPKELREKVLHILDALPDVKKFAEREGHESYEQMVTMLRLGGDLAADAARGGGDDSAEAYERFMATREHVAKRIAEERATAQSE